MQLVELLHALGDGPSSHASAEHGRPAPPRRARPTRRVPLRSQAVRLSVHWCATRGWARFRVRARRVLRALRTPRPPGCALGPSHSRASALAAASRIRKRCLGCVQPHAAEERLERASREPPRWGWGGRPRQKASPGRHAHDHFCVTTSTSTATLTTWTWTGVRWFPPHLPLFIILREIERELCLRGEEGRQKERKIWESGDEEREGGRGDMWYYL